MSVANASTAAQPAWWSQSWSHDGGLDEHDPAADALMNQNLGFADLVDVINPLQHIPVVNTIYKSLTGDEISEPAQMAGSALWGGPLGMITGAANMLIDAESGRNLSEHAVAMLGGEALLQNGGSKAQPLPEAGSTEMLAEAKPDAQRKAPVLNAEMHAAQNQQALQHAAANAGNSGFAMPGGSGPAGNLAAVPKAQLMAAQEAAQTGGGAASFNGAAASRLDAFIRNASAVRNSRPDASTQTAALPRQMGDAPQPAVESLTPKAAGGIGYNLTAPLKPNSTVAAAPSNAVLGAPVAGNEKVGDWMLQALKKYETMTQKDES